MDEHGWVGVDESLPEDEQGVLAINMDLQDDEIALLPHVCKYSMARFFVRHSRSMRDIVYGVTHWQPLPPLPSSGGRSLP